MMITITAFDLLHSSACLVSSGRILRTHHWAFEFHLMGWNDVQDLTVIHKADFTKPYKTDKDFPHHTLMLGGFFWVLEPSWVRCDFPQIWVARLTCPLFTHTQPQISFVPRFHKSHRHTHPLAQTGRKEKRRNPWIFPEHRTLFSRVRPIRKHGSLWMKASGRLIASHWPVSALLKHAVSETPDEVQRLAGVEKQRSFRLVSPCWWCVPSLYGLPAGGLLSSHIHVPPAHIGALHLLAHHQSDPHGLLSSTRLGPFTQTDCNFINFSCLWLPWILLNFHVQTSTKRQFHGSETGRTDRGGSGGWN